MKHVKKVLSFVLAVAVLVTACFTDGFGVFAGVNANGETEIDVTSVYSGHNEEIVTFVLSESDYVFAGVTAKSEEYNFWTNVKVYTGETEYMTLKDAHTNQKYYRMWDRQNTLSVQLKKETYDATTKILIPAGTVFPSYAYDSSTSSTKGGYVTTTDLEFIKPANLVPEQFGPGTPWIKTIPATEEATNVTNIHIRDASGKLLLFLSNQDYSGKGGTIPVNNDKIKEYQFLDKIEVYKSETEHKSLAELYTNEGHYNIWGENGSISLDLPDGWSGTTVTKVVVKAGCQFPSYEYTENGSATKTAYTVKADTTFTATSLGINSTAWTRKAAPVDTPSGVSRIHLRTADAKLLIFPTVSDYSNAPATTAVTLSKIKEYNLLDNVVLYKSDAESKTLRELCSAEADNYYNIWGESKCIALDMENTWNGTTVKKIEFKAGCQFPSYAYTNQSSMDNVAYTLQEDLVFVTNTSDLINTDWTLESTPENTAVTGVKSGHNQNIVTFTLSNSDYTEGGVIGDDKTEYNFWNQIKLYTSETECQTLGEAHYDQKLFNMWGQANTISIQVGKQTETTYNSLTKIEIPAGTVFPSQAYTSGKTQKKGGFRTTEDITFVKPQGATEGGSGYEWTVYVEPTDEDTTITKLQVRGEAGKSSYLFVFLGNNDYADVASNTPVGEKFDEYEILSKIELSTETETKPLSEVITTEKTYNRYGEVGSISFGLKTGWDGTTIKRITFKQGAEFPAYSYTNGSASAKKSYILQEEITFATNTSDLINLDWSEYYEPIVNETVVENIHVRDGFVLLFLSNHDYAEVGGTTPIGDRLSAYNLTDNITITTAEGTKKLSEILGEEVYYNIWGEPGCVAFKMKGGYDGTTIKRVAVKKGAEFPAYAYTFGGTKAKTSYVTDKDYVFTTNKTDAANNIDWTKVTPHSIETEVSAFNVEGKTITITLTENDYVAGIAGDGHKDFDYWNKVKVYTDDTTAVTLGEWAGTSSLTYGVNTLSLTGSSAIVRIVIPAKTVFPSYKYTSGQIGECVGYYVSGEVVFEKQDDGTWKDISVGISNLSGDVNGDNEVNSKDIVAMAKYLEKGYRYNVSSLTYDSTADDATNRHNVRKVLLGGSLHNYVKESDSLTYFSSSDTKLDSFLNDFYKRQVGYTDYVEGDMMATSYKPGTHSDGVFNIGWTTAGLTWLDTANSLETDRLASQKKILENVIVDKNGYVWSGDDTVEDTSTNMYTNGAKRSMSWTFPNALHTNQEARFWEFHDATTNFDTSKSKWSSNIGATIANGVYSGAATNKDTVYFEVVDNTLLASSRKSIIQTKYSPWLAIDLRMNTADYANIDDIYVSFTTSKSGSYTEVKASDIAALDYNFTEDYAHMLWLPMYKNENWIKADGTGNSIYNLKIEIKAKADTTLSGTFALNYVRPSFDTRDSNTNGIYISSLKQYFDYTGDMAFLNENIAKARKAMDLYMAMYDSNRSLIKQSYFYGHNGDRNSIESGVGNGYWDTLYKPEYDFESNMYFYQALKDLAEMEAILGNDASNLKSTADAVLTAMQADVSADGFYNSATGRFAAGKDSSGNTVDYGYTTWNLQAIELGIATDAQAESIMSWLDGTSNLYDYAFAPRTATVDDKNIYGYLTKTQLLDVYNLGYGNDVQFGGAVMYTSYYDLTSRISVLGADNALGRLKGIQSWYEEVSKAYKNSSETANNFYLPYFTEKGITMQNGLRGTGNGAVGIDGEFTESLLVASAIPYGFFGMDSEGGNTLCVSPSLPSTMDRWKVENMQYHGVTYDLSIYKDAVRIDSVRGNADGLNVKVTLDCPSGKDIYVNDVAQNVTAIGGKATVTVSFADAIIEVR